MDTSEDSANDRRLIVLLVHLSMLFAWLIMPLIVWLMTSRDRGLRAESAKAFDFQLTVFLVLIATQVGIAAAAVADVGVLVLALFVVFATLIVAAMVVCVRTAVSSFRGDEVHYPISLRLLQQR